MSADRFVGTPAEERLGILVEERDRATLFQRMMALLAFWTNSRYSSSLLLSDSSVCLRSVMSTA